MTKSTSSPRVPGTMLLKLARLLFNEQVLSVVVQPTIADLQRDIAEAGPHRIKRLRARWLGYRAFWTLTVVVPFAAGALLAADTGAVAFPDALGRLAVASIVVALLAIAGPALAAWVAVFTAAGALFAMLIHKWYDRHPSDIPIPADPQRSVPQINFSSTEVAGNIGGLIFVIGSVFIVVVGLPPMIWFLFAALIAGCFLAWALIAWHQSHPRYGLPENRIALR